MENNYYERIDHLKYKEYSYKIIDIGEYLEKISEFFKFFQINFEICTYHPDNNPVKNGYFKIKLGIRENYLFLIPDEWFIISSESGYHKCDQFDGLMEFLNQEYK